MPPSTSLSCPGRWHVAFPPTYESRYTGFADTIVVFVVIAFALGSVYTGTAASTTPGLVQAGANILADIGIFALPIPVVIKLQMPLKRKVAVCGIFVTGFLALVLTSLGLVPKHKYSSCMPSLAGFWKINISDTRLYKGLQSLLSLAKRSSSEVKNTNHDVHEYNSSSSLDRQAFEDASNTNKRAQDQGVYRLEVAATFPSYRDRTTYPE
ncbi:hypothetical protein PG997_006736 [Apiospora hydei]|uniref:Rhodopsin domain-containing protein n=1 Tax=Apiospora hydei TaxID=1337664 RepID=A0ABR1WPJ0_9PEZI